VSLQAKQGKPTATSAQAAPKASKESVMSGSSKKKAKGGFTDENAEWLKPASKSKASPGFDEELEGDEQPASEVEFTTSEADGGWSHALVFACTWIFSAGCEVAYHIIGHRQKQFLYWVHSHRSCRYAAC
jgi:hypothetical protein